MADRFWEKVDQRGPDDCWEWTAARWPKGYGQFWYPGNPHGKDHRASYELNVGPIPDGMHVLHHCDNPPCVNPAHLFLGTNADNTADKIAKGRAVPPPRPAVILRGEQIYAARLTTQDVIAIRERYAAGESQASIQRSYGIGSATIHAVVHRLSWRHVA